MMKASSFFFFKKKERLAKMCEKRKFCYRGCFLLLLLLLNDEAFENDVRLKNFLFQKKAKMCEIQCLFI